MIYTLKNKQTNRNKNKTKKGRKDRQNGPGFQITRVKYKYNLIFKRHLKELGNASNTNSNKSKLSVNLL